MAFAILFLFGSRGEERSYMKCILSPVAVTKICCLLSLRQILTAATPFCSLSRPQDALANVPLRPDLFLFLFDLFGIYTRKPSPEGEGGFAAGKDG